MALYSKLASVWPRTGSAAALVASEPPNTQLLCGPALDASKLPSKSPLPMLMFLRYFPKPPLYLAGPRYRPTALWLRDSLTLL